jgi:hypothetical protein
MGGLELFLMALRRCKWKRKRYFMSVWRAKASLEGNL